MASPPPMVLLLIVGGAIGMLASILYTRRLFERLGENAYRQRWRVLFGLMIFFLLGYIAALGVAFGGYGEIFQMLTGLVFLFGALYVFMVVNTGLLTVDDLQEKMADAKEARREAERAHEEAEVAQAQTMEMNEHLQERADEYAATMRRCAVGDLTQRMAADGENEAMDRIAAEFNEMVDELEKTVGQLSQFADEVETAGEVVQDSSESVRTASEQVADSIQRISDDADSQQERLAEICETMDGVADDLEACADDEAHVEIDETRDRIDEVTDALNVAVDLSEETLAEAENVAGAAEEQAAELNEVSQRAADLTHYAGPLRDVLARFETESEHEFVYATGPGSSSMNANTVTDQT